MTPERWQQIKAVLHEARELPPEDRPALIEQVCSTHPSLRRELESLLSSRDKAQSNLLKLSESRVLLARGTRLGDYEVQSILGSGGMGQVYRARDQRLDRDVAIKVLPDFLSSNKDRLLRFEREARAAAALNHPNILS